MAKSWAIKGYEMTNKNSDITNAIKTQRVTADQVAEAAGVSQSAVSRVYTPGASVSQKIRDKVKKAAKELDKTIMEVLNNKDHRWYLGKMDPKEAAKRKKSAKEFKSRYKK